MRLSYRSLGFSLLVALGLTACEPNGGTRIVRQSGGAGFIDAQATMVQLECSCVGELEGLASEEACFDDYTAELDEGGVRTVHFPVDGPAIIEAEGGESPVVNVRATKNEKRTWATALQASQK